MIYSNAWKDYELLDCSDGMRLERWADYILQRPDPQFGTMQRRIRLGKAPMPYIIALQAAAETGRCTLCRRNGRFAIAI